jgi:O-antigen ligase
MASGVFFHSLFQPSRIEARSIVVAALLSPLWFFTIGGINLNPADLVFLFVWISFVLRTGLLPYSMSRKTGLAIFVFLTVVGLSLLWSPNKLSGILSFAQYLFIFLAVVPVVTYSLRDRSVRWQVFLAIWAATTVLTILGLFTFIFGDISRLRDITLWYGNQNQFYWLVASALFCSIALVLEGSLAVGKRIGSALLAVVEASLIIEGLTLSAILMLGAGVWLFTAWLVQSHSRRGRVAFAIATLLAGVVGLALSSRYWDLIYLQGSLGPRTRQYTAAIHLGIQYFPLGVGIDGYSVSVHNTYLDYFAELGIVGAGAFLALVIVWCRDVLLRSLYHPTRLKPFEYAFVVIFATYLLILLFQPVPVRRFWWILFGASWAVVQDRLTSAPSRHD